MFPQKERKKTHNEGPQMHGAEMMSMHCSTGVEREEKVRKKSAQFSIPTKSHPLELFITCTTVGVGEARPS